MVKYSAFPLKSVLGWALLGWSGLVGLVLPTPEASARSAVAFAYQQGMDAVPLSDSTRKLFLKDAIRDGLTRQSPRPLNKVLRGSEWVVLSHSSDERTLELIEVSLIDFNSNVRHGALLDYYYRKHWPLLVNQFGRVRSVQSDKAQVVSANSLNVGSVNPNQSRWGVMVRIDGKKLGLSAETVQSLLSSPKVYLELKFEDLYPGSRQDPETDQDRNNIAMVLVWEKADGSGNTYIHLMDEWTRAQ